MKSLWILGLFGLVFGILFVSNCHPVTFYGTRDWVFLETDAIQMTDTFDNGPNYPGARGRHAMTTLQGTTDSVLHGGSRTETWIYHSATHEWDLVIPISPFNEYVGCGLVSGPATTGTPARIAVLFGGCVNFACLLGFSDDTWIFDNTTNSSSPEWHFGTVLSGSPPSPRGAHNMWAMKEDFGFYVACGMGVSGFANCSLVHEFRFRPVEGSPRFKGDWSVLPSFGTPPRDVAQALCWADFWNGYNRLWVYGGDAAPADRNGDVFYFDVPTTTWTQVYSTANHELSDYTGTDQHPGYRKGMYSAGSAGFVVTIARQAWLFGLVGCAATTCTTNLNDLWMLDMDAVTLGTFDGWHFVRVEITDDSELDIVREYSGDPKPGDRYDHQIAVVDKGGRMELLLFGGQTPLGEFLGDLWSLLLADCSSNPCQNGGVCIAGDLGKDARGTSVGESETERVFLRMSVSVCLGWGVCVGADECVCDEHHHGPNCVLDYFCDGLRWDGSTVCNGRGDCRDADENCVCDPGYQNSPVDFCGTIICPDEDGDPVLSTEPTVCGGHGDCVAFNSCVCTDPMWDGAWCTVGVFCDGYLYSEPLACSGHGTCVTHDECVCDAGYSGDECEIHGCFGTPSANHDVCSSVGECFDLDRCWCPPDHYGEECAEYVEGSVIVERFVSDSTGEFLSDTLTFAIVYVVDLAHVAPSELPANEQEFLCGDRLIRPESVADLGLSSARCMWTTYDAEATKTAGVQMTLPEVPPSFDFEESGSVSLLLIPLTADNIYDSINVDVLVTISRVVFTNTNGSATGGTTGLDTASTATLIAFAVLVPLCLLAVASMIVVCFCRKVKKQRVQLTHFGQLEDFDIVLQEQKAEKQTGVDAIKVNKDCFVIPYEEVQLEKPIGHGGSGCTVYRALWQAKICAIKVFRITDVTSAVFEDFQREISIALSVRHPNILSIWGASVKLPRIAIVMEYCELGELGKYILMCVNESMELSYSTKLRLIHEIASGMAYLHSRDIVHRDLKAENVLLDGSTSCRIMDFGLSKIVDRGDQTARMTRGVGTSVYMAPEVVLGRGYSEKCDLFSFGILAHEVLTENFRPYGPGVLSGIEIRVATDPAFRPQVDESVVTELRDVGIASILELIASCWTHEPGSRPEFSEVVEELGKYREIAPSDEANAPLPSKPVESVESAACLDFDLEDVSSKRLKEAYATLQQKFESAQAELEVFRSSNGSVSDKRVSGKKRSHQEQSEE